MATAGKTERRQGESLVEAAQRVAIDALYATRDSGGTMHDAGVAAGDAASSIYAAAVDVLRGVLTGRVVLDETDDGQPILLDTTTSPATIVHVDALGGR